MRLHTHARRPPAPAVNGGLLRVALSQLDGSKRTLNGSASWVVDTFFDTVRACGAGLHGAWVRMQCSAGPPAPAAQLRRPAVG